MQFGIRAALLGQRELPTPERLKQGSTGLAQAQALPSAPRRSPRQAAAAAPAAPAAPAAEADAAGIPSGERPSKRQKTDYVLWTQHQKAFALKKLATFSGTQRQPCQQPQPRCCQGWRARKSLSAHFPLLPLANFNTSQTIFRASREN